MKSNIYQEFDNIMNKLANNMKTGIFLGAGSSMAAGMQGIDSLTEMIVSNSLYKDDINKIMAMENSKNNTKCNIEHVLNSVRMIRSLTNDQNSLEVFGIDGKKASEIDDSICKGIYTILSGKELEIEEDANLFQIFERFVSWTNNLRNSSAVEIFTTNYDLLLEKAFESMNIPYFDGFIGSYRAFFHQESVETIEKSSSLPLSWIRLWKLHGSLNWFWSQQKNRDIVIRSIQELKNDDREIVIYPSKEKYTMSRKQPFTSFFDRLKAFLVKSETLFIIQGYSFNDQHINDVIYTSLTNNLRLHIIAFVFDDEIITTSKDIFEKFKNLSVYSPKRIIKSGNILEWDFDIKGTNNFYNNYIDYEEKKVLLSDFRRFTEFLIRISNFDDGENDE